VHRHPKLNDGIESRAAVPAARGRGAARPGFARAIRAGAAAVLALSPALSPGSALGFGNEHAKLVIHLTAPSAKAQCSTFEKSPPFHPVTSGGLYPPHTYFAYILVMGGSFLDGLGGVEFGIDYDGEPDSGVEIYDWTFCGALQYPAGGWPAAGGGNLISWNWEHDRRLHGRGVLGYLYLGALSPDRLRITASPGKSHVLVSDSRAMIDLLPREAGVSVGAADFGGGAGVDPTRGVPPYEPSTWRAIARLF
jgi:hypothetical protein